MKSIPLFFTIFILSILTSLSGNAQDSVKLNTLLGKVKRLADEQPIEKVYLHFDKPYYAVADTMWFKAYVTIEQNIPTPFSKIVYVEVFNSKDSLVKAVKLPLKNSVAYGNIPLNMQSFKQGNYYVRAYTLWMLNFSEDYFFTKNILIGEAIDKEVLTNISYTNEEIDKNVKTTAKIQFKDIDKKVYANKLVNWSIISRGDVFTKGRGTTDQNGFLTITVTSKNGELITNGSILTAINTTDKETVNAVFDLKQTTNAIDFQFFPEGGSLISGLPTQIAFKATGANGLGVDVKGSILNDDNAEVSVISPSYAGMGSFYLSPEDGKNYKAKVIFKDGSTKIYPLPKSTPSGITLQVNNQSPDLINLKVIANSPYFEANKGKSFFIVAQNTNVVYYAAKAILANQLINIRIPKKGFPAGITQLTLFSAENVPLSERLVFLMKPGINLSIKTDLPIYKARQKVNMSINAGVAGDFSIAVIDEQKVPVNESTETTILSSLLLTSDLRGYIEKPNYYFTKTDDKKISDLDKLMLTQGYRRFTYSDILADKYPQISYLPEQGISLSGTLRDLTGMPVKKGALRLMVPGKPISAELLTSNTGLFNFQNLVFPDSSQVVISAKYNANGANMMIDVNGLPIPQAGKNKNVFDEAKNIDTVLSAYLNNSQKQYRYLRTLKEVVIKGAPVKKVSHLDHSALSSLSQMADHTIDADQFTTCGGNFLDCVRARAIGLTYDQNQEKFYVTRDYNQGSRTPVQVFLNNFAVDARDINSVNLAELVSVEIFLTDQLGSIDRAYQSKGVLVINTKKPVTGVGTKISKQEFFDMLPKKNIITITPMGYSKEREFYSPKYLPNAAITSSDLRTTIYWNPKVITDATGKANVEFFNADGKGTYRAVIEGFDKDGNIGRAVYRYKVN
ncbi:carboxypeptidase regulatory-like domain-containing protein [Pedobacter sp. Du54]|uniref:carboxypeptidase regulatory-like domain-containing protein n=1 Tax=Pedobacter anseongensis TaxID=3133439 RepID=UPI0030B4D0E5